LFYALWYYKLDVCQDRIEGRREGMAREGKGKETGKGKGRRARTGKEGAEEGQEGQKRDGGGREGIEGGTEAEGQVKKY
jgi:hypothetical protein